MTIKYLPHGLNEENVVLVEDTVAGPISDTANFTITVTDLIGKGAKPLAVRCSVESGGPAAVGARTWTLYPEEGAAGVGVQPVSYVETTGVLTMANQSGGALSNIHVTALFALAGAL